MGRGFLSKRQALRSLPSITPTCAGGPHWVLAHLSASYPHLRGRLPTCSSPFRHCHPHNIAITGNIVRLACLIHAASVRSEPESNSPKKRRALPAACAAGYTNLIRAVFTAWSLSVAQPHHFLVRSDGHGISVVKEQTKHHIPNSVVPELNYVVELYVRDYCRARSVTRLSRTYPPAFRTREYQ